MFKGCLDFIIPRTTMCEAIFVMLSTDNQVVRPKAMHKTKQREVLELVRESRTSSKLVATHQRQG